jgi:spore germination cell wall hydrolase CwlJ-like protein
MLALATDTAAMPMAARAESAAVGDGRAAYVPPQPWGNQALLRLSARAPYLARQTAAPAQAPAPGADSVGSSFKSEVEKELEAVPAAAGADKDAPKTYTLKVIDQDYVKKQIVLGQFYSQANKGLVAATGEKQHDATAIAEHFLCTWNTDRVATGRTRLIADPLFCDDPKITADVMATKTVRDEFTDKYIGPAYDAGVVALKAQGAVTQSAAGKVETVRPDKTKSDDPAQQSDLVLFAENLHAEAGLEADAIGPKALEAVAQVVLNRMACTGQSARSNILKQGQFSWVTPSNPVHDQRNPKNASVWNQCVEVSIRALNGGVDGGVDGADHYFSTAIDPPSWANEDCFVAQVGKHKFYKLSCLGTVCAKPQP